VSEVRSRIRVRGQVQGVGFRPFVFRLAGELGLSGWVRNDGEGVEIEVQGREGAVSRLLARLESDAPGPARIDSLEAQPQPAVEPSGEFVIQPSRGGPVATAVTPDVAVCPECLAELFDPADRRYRYPFINCTHCGPRYTITRQLPYDRPHTSMAVFALCPACRQEYETPTDRRFHAQPNACPTCGPRLDLRVATADAPPFAYDSARASARSGSESLCGNKGGPGGGSLDPIAETLHLIREGRILAIKGLGGFHLVCDARNGEAVARLRMRKQREEKPFAVMVAGVASISPFATFGEDEQALLESAERPIVLLEKTPGCDNLLPGVAPGLAGIGVMLPYTPLHYLLFHEAAGRPTGNAWLDEPQPLALLMTSANPGGEPLVVGNDEAMARLAGIADAFLLHDRDILIRCDDSVVRVAAAPFRPDLPTRGGKGRTSLTQAGFIRRARGFTPRAVRLAQAGPPVLALGGWFKNTVCLTRGDEAFVSQHIGDLDNAATCNALEETAAHLMAVLEIQPEAVAHDLHPDFFSTRFAAAVAAERGIPAFAVQHHHAHIAAIMAEHGLEGPALGLALDGVGLGADGAAWGGELLRVEGAGFTRLGSLLPLALPGGDRAAREPWRMAAAALHALGRSGEIDGRFPTPAAGTVRQMLERGLNAPLTSSAGRLFDAAAGLLGIKEIAAFEGQAAMLLEGLAASYGSIDPLSGGFRLESDGRLNLLPLLARLAEPIEPAHGAALFHATLAEALAEWAKAAMAQTGLRQVALGGGCFLNRLLSEAFSAKLGEAGAAVYQARQLPPNDGGLSLGQARVARLLLLQDG
jgi:hydrogenase maturation protein HypF